jgi:hypothetical protein
MIIKTCKIHGELDESKIIREVDSLAKSGFRIRCHQCRLDKDKVYKLNNPTKKTLSANRARDEARRLYRAGLTDVEPRANILARERRKNYPELFKEKERIQRLKEGQLRNTKEVCRRLKLDISDYQLMVNNQNNLCAICGLSETRLSRNKDRVCELAIDHDHMTGKIRELLCYSCNTGLGRFIDDVNLLQKAIDYLNKHKHNLKGTKNV